jgi:imidazolonepropionase-like amidohydrolase
VKASRPCPLLPELALVAALALCACATTESPPLVRPLEATSGVLFRDVRVFTATERGVVQGDVLVEGRRIARVAPAGSLEAAGARVVEGAGRTLLPGLVDAHVHLSLEPAVPWADVPPNPGRALERYLYAGVTTVYDLGGPPELLEVLAEGTESGEWTGPRVLFAGSTLSGPDSHPVPFLTAARGPAIGCLTDLYLPQPRSADEARRAVARAAPGDLYKIIFDGIPRRGGKLGRAPLAAAIDAAHGRGWKVFAHVGDADDAVFAAEAGVDVLAHLSYRGVVTPGMARRIAAAKTTVAPTQVVWQSVHDLALGAFEPSDLDRAVAAELIDGLTDGGGRTYPNPVLDDIRITLKLFQPTWTPSVRALHRAGVNIVAGTDAGLPGVIPGASLHKELAHLARAGLSHEEVLLAATRRGAELLTERPDFGSVEEGKVADLLLVEGDPLSDLSTLSRIVYIMRAGRLIERAGEAP